MASEKPEIQAIFNEAIALGSEADRVRYLDQACRDDLQVRARVAALLRAHSEAGGFFGGKSPAEVATEIHPGTNAAGAQIGPYKLVQQIGEGGFGVVYMAEQTQPVRRIVALKIIKPGMDTSEVIARFETERQALAMMDHPNIAKVLDAGTTAGGRPYFVMELVKGIPITQFCDEQHLTPRQRLELFVPVCQAVQHAHQKGVIHRDIKPSNVLVAMYDDMPVPKVIDFGVAKATGDRLSKRTLFTKFGAIIGTLEYMSPEQAKFNALDIDTRSDIYGLGVLLYELLAGSTPFEHDRLKKVALDELLQIIRREEPPKPSLRLTSSATLARLAAQRKTEPAKLPGLVRGDLDWIVMKAIEKDRARRYETASEFAADIVRHLNHEPVLAGPPGLPYRTRKFLRRHRGPVAAVAAVVAALAVGLAGSLFLYFRAEGLRNVADRLRADAETAQEAEVRRVVQLAEALNDVTQERNLKKAALEDKDRALEDKDRALRRSVALRLATSSLLAVKDNPELAGALAIEAARRSPEPATQNAVLTVMQELPAGRILECDEWVWRWMRFTPSGEQILGMKLNGDIQIWDAATARPLGSFKGLPHTERIVLSPRGDRLAATDENGKLHVWKIPQGETELVIDAKSGPIKNMVFSPNGEQLATASGDLAARAGQVCIWDLDKFQPTVLADGESFYSVNFSPDGRNLVASTRGRRHVRVWALENRQLLLDELVNDGLPWPSVVFTPDGAKVVDLGRDAVCVWEVATGESQSLAAPWNNTNNGFFNVEFGTEGRGWLLTPGAFKHLTGYVGGDWTWRLWDMQQVTVTQSFEGVSDAALTADGRRAAIVRGPNIEVWNAESASLEARLVDRRPRAQTIAISPDGRWVATTHDDGAPYLWDLNDRGVLPTYPKLYAGLAVMRDAQRVAVLVPGEGIEVLDTQTLRTEKRIKLAASWQYTFRSFERQFLAYSRESDRFAARVSDSTLLLVDATTGTVLREINRQFDAQGSLRDEKMEFTAGGKRLLFRNVSGEVELVDAASEQTMVKVQGIPGIGIAGRNGDVVSPDGSRFLVAVAGKYTVPGLDPSDLQEFLIYDGASGKLLRKLDHRGARFLEAVAFSPDGRLLATAIDQQIQDIAGQPFTNASDVTIWDVNTGERVAVLGGAYGNPLCYALFSLDGTTLVTGDSSGMIHVWNVNEKRELTAFKTSAGEIRSISLSSDGTKVAALSHFDNVAGLWDTRTGKETVVLPVQDHYHLSRIVAEGRSLLTVESSGLLRSWPADPLAHMRGREFRPLSEAQRKQFGVE
jgi:serine/threonine protein kinase/WD40 repeat protein